MLMVTCTNCLTKFPTRLELPLSALNNNQIHEDSQQCPICGTNIKLVKTNISNHS